MPPVIAQWLEAVMAVHGLVVFRGLGGGARLSADDQLRISSLFGTGVVFSTHKIHPAAEHPEVMRLSNDARHGFVQGSGGQAHPSPTTAWGAPANGHSWHHDGLHEARPFGHVSYHVPVVPRGAGTTAFAHMGSALQPDDMSPMTAARAAWG